MFSIPNAHNHWVNAARFSPDTRLIASGCEAKESTTVKLWDITSKSCVKSFDDCRVPISDVQFHPDGTCISAAS